MPKKYTNIYSILHIVNWSYNHTTEDKDTRKSQNLIVSCAKAQK